MRVLILGVSTLALGACSMGGGGWGHHQGHHQGPQTYSGHYGSDCGVAVDPCAAAPVAYHQTHQPTPVHHQPAPVYHQPAPVQHAAPCSVDPCSAGSYAVSPYAPAAAYAQAPAYAQTPDAHAYGTHAPAYRHGLRGPHPVQRSGFYGTVGLNMYDVDDDVFGLQGRLGYDFTPNLAAELEGSFGLNSSTEDFTGVDAGGNPVDGSLKADVDYQIGAFAVAGLPVTDKIRAFGRVGYHETKLSLEEDLGGVITEASGTTDGVAYGGGVEIAVSPLDAVRADYTRYDTDAGALDSLSLAYLRRF